MTRQPDCPCWAPGDGGQCSTCGEVQGDEAVCSYCTAPAVFVGEGHDGDSYCPEHRGRASGAVVPR